VESAIAFSVLVVIALFLVQVALYVHAENVTMGACQDGVRAASAVDGTASDGVARAQSILRAGIGTHAAGMRIQGVDTGTTVVIEAQGGLPMILPWLGNPTLPLHARAMMEKERFRASNTSR